MKLKVTRTDKRGHEQVTEVPSNGHIVGTAVTSNTTALDEYTRLIVLDPKHPNVLGLGSWFFPPINGRLEIEAL